jgi:thiamine pyrophosphate-dependent acetolactate synthase large subunit-like protein
MYSVLSNWSKVANPNQDVICVTGDSSIQMSIQELTISQYQLGIKVLIINNGWQGMVRQWLARTFMEIAFQTLI